MSYFSEYSERQKIRDLETKKNDFQYSTYEQYSKDIKEFLDAAKQVNDNIWSARQQLVVNWALGSAVDKVLNISKFGLPWDIKGKMDTIKTIAKHIKEEAWSAFTDYQLQSAINDLQSKQDQIERYLTDAKRYQDEIDNKIRTMDGAIGRLSRKYDKRRDIEGNLRSLGFGDMLGFERNRLQNELDRVDREIRDLENDISRNAQFYCYVNKPC
jgi:hypothetical protein